MPVFDTSALLPLFIHDHPDRDQAKKCFNSSKTIVLHPAVISEFTTVLRRLTRDRGFDGNQAARNALAALLKEPRVAIRVEMDYQEVVDLYLRDPRLSFTDAVVVRSSTHFDKQEPVTFDKKIIDAARSRKTD